MSKNRNIIAVYGSLRNGFGNHQYLLSDSKLLGIMKTEPVYTLHGLGGFPGLKKNGNTAVVVEIYEVDKKTARNVDGLEGYQEGVEPTFYDKEYIDTSWGKAGIYIYMGNPNNPVESGDWTLHRTGKTNYEEPTRISEHKESPSIA